jgi:MerR family transcriptional regulator, copper efflux regulator
VRFIGRARNLGFNLRDVATHLHSPEDGDRKGRLQARLEAKLAELDAHIEQVRVRRAMILEIIEEVRQARAHGHISGDLVGK